jgi:hypothetical protein
MAAFYNDEPLLFKMINFFSPVSSVLSGLCVLSG